MNHMHSENINEISAALSKVQGELRSVQKDGSNPHFKSKFASLNSHWDACREILNKNNLAVSQMTAVLDVATGKTILVTILSHSSGQWYKSYYPLNPVKNDPQGMGSCLTYARRYMLSAMIGTTADEEDDDGNKASEPPKPQPKPQAKKENRIITEEGIEELKSFLKNDHELKAKIDKHWEKNNISSFEQLSVEAFNQMLERARARAAEVSK